MIKTKKGLLTVDNTEIRLRNALEILKDDFDNNKAEFARAIGRARGKPVSGSVVRRWFIHTDEKRNIGSAYARAIEKAANKPRGWLDNPRKKTETLPGGNNHAAMVPLFTLHSLAEWASRVYDIKGKIGCELDVDEGRRVGQELHDQGIGTQLDYVPTTIPNPDNIIAITVEGESMSPICPPGTILYVDYNVTTDYPPLGSYIIAFNKIDRTCFFRRFSMEGDICYLVPENDRYSVIEATPDVFGCLGVVVRAVTTRDFITTE